MKDDLLPVLVKKLETLNESEALSFFAELFPEKIVFSTSFGMEDQVITDLIFRCGEPVEIFTLDTGRLFSETYYTWAQTNEHYHTCIKTYFPDYNRLEVYLDNNGPNSFYDSVDLRKQCCYIRKVEPLARALEGKDLWITGMRAEQSAARHNHPQIEWDEIHNIYIYHPLLYWKTEEVKDYISKYHVPCNPLHAKGFASIGCQPCTRAIRPGEDFRAGRWWWEGEDTSRNEKDTSALTPD